MPNAVHYTHKKAPRGEGAAAVRLTRETPRTSGGVLELEPTPVAVGDVDMVRRLIQRTSNAHICGLARIAVRWYASYTTASNVP